MSESNLIPTIGLEIHVQLQTKTKMFCGCELEFGAEPNTHTCAVCLGHPGTLPVINEQAVAYAIRIALALGCDIAPRSTFHRKNYFYPDLPKGYQISQYDVPLATDGRLGDVRIHRVHMEEDAAKLSHVGDSGRIHGSGASLVDFNRGGTPLVEIVTEPDIDDPAEAREWLALLRTTLRQLGVSDVNMEEGSLRCDANVSVRPAGTDVLGTKTELKNMNSFRYLERGVAAEIARQRDLIESGAAIEQETLHFDPAGGTLTPLRSKEYAHDYRYFPEPDLVPLVPAPEEIESARAALPELPEQRRERYGTELGLNSEASRLLAFDADLADFFERAVAAGGDLEAAAIAKWVTGDLVATARAADAPSAAETGATPQAVAELVALVESGKVNRGGAREVLAVLVEEGGDPAAIVEQLDLGASSDAGELEAIVDRAIEAQPDAAAKVRTGEGKAIGALVGAVMKETRGRADGGEVTKIIRERLGR
jgi:aspartyl-tRNA(Asn)/glutamyl-tRNA(Gln) amidotransferase subunit B